MTQAQKKKTEGWKGGFATHMSYAREKSKLFSWLLYFVHISVLADESYGAYEVMTFTMTANEERGGDAIG